MSRVRFLRRNESGFTLIELLVVMLILGFLAALFLPALFGGSDKPSGKPDEAAAAVHRAIPAPGPSRQAVRAFVMEARIDSCLSPDRSYAPNAVYKEHHAGCADRPWTPDRQHRYCMKRLDRGNPHIDTCSTASPVWAYPTLLLTKLPQLIDYICNDDAEQLRRRYDQVIDAYYRAVTARERADLDNPIGTIYWFRNSEEIDC